VVPTSDMKCQISILLSLYYMTVCIERITLFISKLIIYFDAKAHRSDKLCQMYGTWVRVAGHVRPVIHKQIALRT
jgi:hypothetical protein